MDKQTIEALWSVLQHQRTITGNEQALRRVFDMALTQPEEVSMRDALKEIYRLTVVTTGCPMEKAHQLIHQLAKPFVGADPYGSGPQKD